VLMHKKLKRSESAKVFRKDMLSVKLCVNQLQKKYIIVLVTTTNKQEAENIVQQLLKEHLIACANIVGPVSSFFRWSNEIEKAEEYLVFMKSRENIFEKLTKKVKKLHSYEVPEIVALPIVEGSKAYLGWLDSCLARSERD
jgi:periplasmic divalent cation tolerance protein